MSDAGAEARKHRSPASGIDGISAFADSTHHSRSMAFSGDGAMGRDRSGDSLHGSRGRGQAQQHHRGSTANAHSRLRSPSPPPKSRPSQRRRSRDRKYYDGDTFAEEGERRMDERRRSRSPDHRGHYFEESRRSKNSPVPDAHLDPLNQHGGSSPPRHHSKAGHHSERTRDRSFSPGSRKRPRSRSPLPFPSSRSKRSKRDRDRDRDRERERRRRAEREERSRQKGHGSSRTSRPHSPSRRRSISPRYDGPHRRHGGREEPMDGPRRRSRSPLEDMLDDRYGTPPTRPRIDAKMRDQSRSPRPSSRRSSFSHAHSPSRSVGRAPPRGPSEKGTHSRTSPYDQPPRHEYPPRSPRDRSSRRSRKKAKIREERFHPRGLLASGANSIEVNAFRRTDRLNSFDPPDPPDRPRDMGMNPEDDLPAGRLPSQASYSSPHQGSIGSPRHSAAARTDVAGHPRYSPTSPHPRDRGVRIPTGPAAHQPSIPTSPRAPTGPMAQGGSGSRGFSRASFRGEKTSDREGLDNYSSRPPRSSQWVDSRDSNKDPSSPPGRDVIPIRSGTPVIRDADRRGETESQQRDDRLDTRRDETASAAQKSPPGPPASAPTGPASSKFSFAFKTSNKNPVAAPKPEISQKFSAAPKKEPPRTIDDRQRDLPKDTPREPASARARGDYHHGRPPLPPPPPPPPLAPPPEQPRTRKVIKVRRKLKPKPVLEPELARSTSVYFRKPGNESVIGSGTYGKVFKAQHVYTKKLVALKRIRMEGERDGFPVTALREIKLLSSLRHENIVDLHEVMIEKNECYMVFEYLSHDLTGLLNHPSYKLDAAQKKHLSKQLFEGLDYLHKRGVLHRDIKAANILVSNEGILKLADFGLARFYAKRHQLDYTNRVITIWYRSPELLLGETRYGAAVDIWSAACVMVEIFTRHAIFPGDGGEISQLDKIYNILGTPNRKEWPGLVDTPWFELLRPSYRKPNVFAEKYKERVPAAAYELLSQMFQYDPVKRPSAADVLEHAYFTVEQPPPRQAVELKHIKGDWHEFESKAHRREKEKQEKQQRDARRVSKENNQDRDKKRPPSARESQPESKRPHIEGEAAGANREPDAVVVPTTVEKAAGDKVTRN
ncbi:Pkinase-domain-containing protein [Poronia punctata]|nr:Pkinase-domain-containing protein [Poronia punctata]